MENLPECGITHEQRAGSFSTVPNYDNDDEAWSVDDIGELQVEVRELTEAIRGHPTSSPGASGVLETRQHPEASAHRRGQAVLGMKGESSEQLCLE